MALERSLVRSGFDVRTESFRRFADGCSEVRAYLRLEQIAVLVRNGFSVLVLKQVGRDVRPRVADPAEAAKTIAASVQS